MAIAQILPSRHRLLGYVLSGLLTLGVLLGAMPAAYALGGPQPDLNAPAPAFVLPSNTGDGEI